MSAAAPRGAGRPRDPAVDEAVLRATIALLAEEGYAALSIEAVANAAGVSRNTIYRRWPDKPAMVLDAIACKADEGDDRFEDSGDLRADLTAMLTHVGEVSEGVDGRIFRSLLAELGTDPELAEAVRAQLVEPRRREMQARVQRAVDRGELPADADVDLLASVGPAVMFHRLVFLGEPFSPELPRRIVAQFFPPLDR